MKKLLVCLAVALALVLSPIGSRDIPAAINKMDEGDCTYDVVKSNHLFVTSFYDEDYRDLVTFTKHLKEGDTLTLTIMSGGGPAIPMIAMFEHLQVLKAKGIKIVTEVAGLSASAAALLWLMGDERIVHNVDIVMFHTAVIFDAWGNPVPRDKMDKTAGWIVDQANYFVRQLLLNILHDTELVNKLLANPGNLDDKNNMNWFTGEEIHKMGISTELREVI